MKDYTKCVSSADFAEWHRVFDEGGEWWKVIATFARRPGIWQACLTEQRAHQVADQLAERHPKATIWVEKHSNHEVLGTCVCVPEKTLLYEELGSMTPKGRASLLIGL